MDGGLGRNRSPRAALLRFRTSIQSVVGVRIHVVHLFQRGQVLGVARPECRRRQRGGPTTAAPRTASVRTTPRRRVPRRLAPKFKGPQQRLEGRAWYVSREPTPMADRSRSEIATATGCVMLPCARSCSVECIDNTNGSPNVRAAASLSSAMGWAENSPGAQVSGRGDADSRASRGQAGTCDSSVRYLFRM
jgi:hypothetical protein